MEPEFEPKQHPLEDFAKKSPTARVVRSMTAKDREDSLFPSFTESTITRATRKLGISPETKSWEGGDASDVKIAPEAIGACEIVINSVDQDDPEYFDPDPNYETGYAYFKKGVLVACDDVWNDAFGTKIPENNGDVSISYEIPKGKASQAEIEARVEESKFSKLMRDAGAKGNHADYVKFLEASILAYYKFEEEVKKRRHKDWCAVDKEPPEELSL